MSQPPHSAVAPVKMHTNVVLKHDAKPDASTPPGAALTRLKSATFMDLTRSQTWGPARRSRSSMLTMIPTSPPTPTRSTSNFTRRFPGTTSLYSAYGDSSTWLTVAYAQGSKPATNSGWDLEISLDVESAAVPCAGSQDSAGRSRVEQQHQPLRGRYLCRNPWRVGDLQ